MGAVRFDLIGTLKAMLLTGAIALRRAKSATQSLDKTIARLINSFVLRERHIVL